ncbi:hypothetical protein IWQ56_007200, partial [Coemansia nantahalensis]
PLARGGGAASQQGARKHSDKIQRAQPERLQPQKVRVQADIHVAAGVRRALWAQGGGGAGQQHKVQREADRVPGGVAAADGGVRVHARGGGGAAAGPARRGRVQRVPGAERGDERGDARDCRDADRGHCDAAAVIVGQHVCQEEGGAVPAAAAAAVPRGGECAAVGGAGGAVHWAPRPGRDAVGGVAGDGAGAAAPGRDAQGGGARGAAAQEPAGGRRALDRLRVLPRPGAVAAGQAAAAAAVLPGARLGRDARH